MARVQGGLSVVRLMRTGERESDSDTESGLRKDGKGERLIEEIGEKLSKESGFQRLPFDKILIAPSRIAEGTADALIRHSNILATHAPFVVTPEVHFQDHRRQHWSAVAMEFAKIVCTRNQGKKDEEKEAGTLADLEKAACLCAKQELIEENFLAQEAERIFTFITAELNAMPPESAILCIMHSPLPETIMLWLWHQASERFRKEKSLDKLPALDHMETYSLGFENGVFTRSVAEHFVKMLREKKHDMELATNVLSGPRKR